MNPILKKLQFKGQSPLLMLARPPEFQETAEAFDVPVHNVAKGKYAFVLAFARSHAEAEAHAKQVKQALADPASIFWLAYPKGSSKKYQADVNRDSLHASMQKLGFDGVSLVALDQDWSAMRFKPLAPSGP